MKKTTTIELDLDQASVIYAACKQILVSNEIATEAGSRNKLSTRDVESLEAVVKKILNITDFLQNQDGDTRPKRPIGDDIASLLMSEEDHRRECQKLIAEAKKLGVTFHSHYRKLKNRKNMLSLGLMVVACDYENENSLTMMGFADPLLQAQLADNGMQLLIDKDFQENSDAS